MINVVNLCIILHVFLFSVGKLCFQKFIYMYLYLCAWINLYNLWSFLKSDGCLNIASQTAGPNGLTSFVDSWVAGGCVRLKYGLFSIFLKYWKNSIFIHGQRQDLQLAINQFFLNFMKTLISKASSNQNVRTFDFVWNSSWI